MVKVMLESTYTCVSVFDNCGKSRKLGLKHPKKCTDTESHPKC